MSVLTEIPLLAWVLLAAVALMLLLLRFDRRTTKRRPASEGAHARVERAAASVTIAIPPQPGARLFVLSWTLLAVLFMAYVCVIIDASAAGWALFVGTPALLAALIASAHREVFTWYFTIDAEGGVRSSHGVRWRVVDTQPLHPLKQRGHFRLGRDRQGEWYFQHEGRSDDHVWGRVSAEDASLLRSLGVPDDAGAPADLPSWSLVSGLYSASFVLVIAVCAYPMLSPLGKIQGLPKPRLTGDFRADHAALGSWQLTPTRCLSGRERGFEGVLFQFASGSALRELRVDLERPGDALIELQFFEPSRQPVRIAQRECERIDGKTDARVVVINGRDMDLLTGELHVECAGRGLTGDVVFEGCLP